MGIPEDDSDLLLTPNLKLSWSILPRRKIGVSKVPEARNAHRTTLVLLGVVPGQVSVQPFQGTFTQQQQKIECLYQITMGVRIVHRL